MKIEAVVLTGGRSERMGEEKARLAIDGVTLLDRTLAEFDRIGVRATVLGREAAPGRPFLQDKGVFEGPAAALSRYVPREKAVFVCACDLPFFNADCVAQMHEMLAGFDAAVPVLGGRLQPLCALYEAGALEKWRWLAEEGARTMHGLLDALAVNRLDEESLKRAGIDARWLRDVDTPEELHEALRQDRPAT